ncbi:hypothetical protein BHE74_00050710 [Ensete ventricosum]|nr:hypothetical protein BHE74_00050710 [Ensete ventricosum]
MHRVDAVGNSLGVRRELAEGIRSLLGWRKGVRQKKTEIRRKIIGGSRKTYRDDGCTVAAQAFRRLNRSYLGIWILSAVDPPRSAGKPPIPGFSRYVGFWLRF